MRLASIFALSRAIGLLALPGCLVSFNDYPLGDPKLEPVAGAGRAAAGAGGSATAGRGSGGGGSQAVAAGASLLDDFEDGNAAILELEGRSATWYVANDGRGMQTPPGGTSLLPSLLSPPRGESTQGVHTFGGPFSTWGALAGTAFVSNGNGGAAYDLSAHRGLRLWVRSGNTTAAKQVRLNLRTPATIAGGACTTCNDHLGTEIPLTSKWAQVDVPFASLKQVGYGRPVVTTADLKHALGIELLFPPNVSFDLWVDDVEFY